MVPVGGITAIITHGPAIDCHGPWMRQQVAAHQFSRNRWHPAGTMIVFAEILTRRLKVDQQWNFMAD